MSTAVPNSASGSVFEPPSDRIIKRPSGSVPKNSGRVTKPKAPPRYFKVTFAAGEVGLFPKKYRHVPNNIITAHNAAKKWKNHTQTEDFQKRSASAKKAANTRKRNTLQQNIDKIKERITFLTLNDVANCDMLIKRSKEQLAVEELALEKFNCENPLEQSSTDAH